MTIAKQPHEPRGRALPAGVAAAAVREYDAALARMGSDVCIYSLELAIDEIAGEVTADPRESDAVRASLRTRAGLSTA